MGSGSGQGFFQWEKKKDFDRGVGLQKVVIGGEVKKTTVLKNTCMGEKILLSGSRILCGFVG